MLCDKFILSLSYFVMWCVSLRL